MCRNWTLLSQRVLVESVLQCTPIELLRKIFEIKFLYLFIFWNVNIFFTNSSKFDNNIFLKKFIFYFVKMNIKLVKTKDWVSHQGHGVPLLRHTNTCASGQTLSLISLWVGALETPATAEEDRKHKLFFFSIFGPAQLIINYYSFKTLNFRNPAFLMVNSYWFQASWWCIKTIGFWSRR